MYDDIFVKNGPPKEPWMIVFIKKTKDETWHNQSEMVVNAMKLMADWYQEDVRFGWIDIITDEYLKETYDVKSVPAQYYVKDGTV